MAVQLPQFAASRAYLPFLAGTSEMAGRMRELDWSSTPLGSPEHWPAALRTTVQTVLSTGQPAFIFWGPELICFYNDAYIGSIGPDKHPRVLGQPAREMYPEIWPVVGAEIEGVLGGSPATWHENALIPIVRNGTLEDVYWTYSYSGIYDETAAGGVGGVLALFTETTSQVEAERSLALSEEQLRLATEAGEVGLWDVDPSADTLYWPQSVKRMFGIFTDRAVTMREDFYLGLHPDDRKFVSEAFAAAVDPNVRALYDVEYRTVGREDGIVRWVAAKGRGLFDTSGRCTRVIGTAIDVTTRKRDEARLKELNETLERRLQEYLAERKLLSDIVEEADTFIQVADLNFMWLAVNRACADEFERIYGVRPKVGSSMLDALDDQPEERERVRAVWQQGFDSDGFVSVSEFGDASRIRRAYEMHFRPYFDGEGNRVGAYQFVYDVTARLEAESRLAKAEAALQQAQKMEAVGRLTGGIAHDFNNLLQAVSTKFELIRRLPGDPQKVGEWAASGTEVAKRGARLTAQLLTFSRQQEPDIQPLGLKALLANMGDLLRTTVGPTVRVSVECTDVWVHADATQLEMSLLNLAVNARDAMPEGGDLVVGCQAAHSLPPEVAPGDYAELRVTDSGSGMPADVIAKAFEPFFTTKAIGQGSGLGLSQVYGMAQRAGGFVRIESDGLHGTTVIILLRMASKTLEEAFLAPPPTAFDEANRSLRVMVVDDDEHVRGSVAETLRSLGHQVVEAGDGTAGLGYLQTHSIDLVLVDFAMPVMNGADFASRARSVRADLPLVFISGYSDGNAIRDSVGQTATLLRKPFDLETLRRAIASSVA